MGFNADLHFSSETPEWYTPQDFFDGLNKEFGFTTDVCATVENAKCPDFFTKEDDGLSRKWTGVCWMNPPYGRTIGKWVEKAYDSSLSLVQPSFAWYLQGLTRNGFRITASSTGKFVSCADG